MDSFLMHFLFSYILTIFLFFCSLLNFLLKIGHWILWWAGEKTEKKEQEKYKGKEE